jgi:plasmid stabilization system protein ParE
VTLRLLDEAKQELRESARWYDEKRPGLGDEFVNAVESALEIIEQRPRQFTQVEIGDESREVRRCVLKRFPYLIVFEILAQETIVVAIAHSKRKPKYWKERLN